MSQPSPVKSLDGSSPTPDLKPGLKVALGSMDVELEAELARYRRQSKKSQPFSPVPTTDIPEGKFQVPPPSLTTASQPPSATPPPTLPQTPAMPPPLRSKRLTPVPSRQPNGLLFPTTI
jgi:hypothetical protein